MIHRKGGPLIGLHADFVVSCECFTGCVRCDYYLCKANIPDHNCPWYCAKCDSYVYSKDEHFDEMYQSFLDQGGVKHKPDLEGLDTWDREWDWNWDQDGVSPEGIKRLTRKAITSRREERENGS